MIGVLLLLGAGLLIFLIKRSERKMAEQQTTSQ
jgi:F0F1-type ATP synthase assembly protein I